MLAANAVVISRLRCVLANWDRAVGSSAGNKLSSSCRACGQETIPPIITPIPSSNVNIAILMNLGDVQLRGLKIGMSLD